MAIYLAKLRTSNNSVSLLTLAIGISFLLKDRLVFYPSFGQDFIDNVKGDYSSW